MVAPAIGAALVSGAASLAGGFLSRGGGISKTMTGYYREEDRKREDTRIQRTVADAKAAGIHPLFAMGAVPATGGGSFMPGQSPSGSALGEGISRAGAQIARGMGRKGQDLLLASQIKSNEASAARDMASAAATDSARKRAEAEALSIRNVEDIGGGAQLFPIGTRSGPPLNRRPLVSLPNQSIPEFIEGVGPGGTIKVMNPELGMDEVAQGHYLIQKLKQYRARKLREQRAIRKRIESRMTRGHRPAWRDF